MKNITLSADDKLIDDARKYAQSRHTTVNELFRQWLEEMLGRRNLADDAVAFIKDLRSRHTTDGKRFTREEMNER